MYVYFVRWTAYSDGKPYGVGQREIVLDEPVSSMKHIEEMKKTIRGDSEFVLLACNGFIAIDFYSLLREE